MFLARDFLGRLESISDGYNAVLGTLKIHQPYICFFCMCCLCLVQVVEVNYSSLTFLRFWSCRVSIVWVARVLHLPQKLFPISGPHIVLWFYTLNPGTNQTIGL